MSSNTPNLNLLKVNPVTDGNDTFNIDTMLNDNWDKIDTTVGNKVDKVSGKQLSTNDYTAADKTKLAGIATGANNYTHPTGDGNQHVPATGTSNSGKVLKAGATAGSSSWGNVNGSEVVEDATHRFATDTEKTTWNAKETTTGSQTKADAAVLPINNRLNTESLTSINLVAGQQILNATKNARLQGLKVQGRTLIDLLGGAGSGESLTGWTQGGGAAEISTTQKRSGNSSFKFVATAGNKYLHKDYDYPIDSSKQYILGAWVFLESFTAGYISYGLRQKGTMTVVAESTVMDTSKIGSWQFVHAKVPLGSVFPTSGFRLLFGPATAAANMTVYIDEVRLYAVSAADYAAIGTTITGEAIDRLLPYVPPGINGVDGLWVRRYGKNLLPDRSQFVMRNNVTAINWTGPGTFELTSTAANAFATALVDVLPNTVYTLSVDADPNINIAVYNATGTTALATYAAIARTFNSGSNTQVQMYYRNTAAGTTRYNNVQFEIGSTATTFQPREDSLIAFGGVELHANPNDGSEPDILREVNGRYEVTKLWREITLSGLQDWTVLSTHTGYKRLRALGIAPTLSDSSISALVKFDGKVLTQTFSDVPSSAAADVYRTSASGNTTVTVSSTDSGWGDSYTPTPDEIKAYFNGWRMYNGASGVATNPYNGTAGQTKGWVEILSAGNPVGVLPTTIPSGWTPYQLLYRLATPTTETVQEDGALSLLEGDNFIEVGSGYISREPARPKKNALSDVYYIGLNDAGNGGDSNLKKRASEIKQVFKNGLPDFWNIDKLADGTCYAWTDNYDTAATYSVSYIKLDKSPVPSVSGAYAATEKMQIHDLTDAVTEISSTVSVLAAKKAEKDAGPWITPSAVLSGFTAFDLAYRVNKGFIEFRGYVYYNITDVPAGTKIFNLPTQFRPVRITRMLTSSWTSKVDPTSSAVSVGVNGDITTEVNAKQNIIFDGLRFPLD
ncbi:hypothetical protein [Paenibacillus sp. FSL L8-0506]|uniref:hypothetical protein n=1 Tax=Paenibacillus sp. FSL L8-0506 TaxID=2975335 RepID=UPI0030F5C417